jgi:putative nucleotidyltransferase with HDIG domain
MEASAASRRSGWAVHRSVTLLRLFLLCSAFILVSGGLVLTSLLGDALRRQAVSDASSSVTQYVDGVLGAKLVHDGSVHISHNLPATIGQQLRRDRDIVSVKVWRADGVLAWTNRAQQRIGRRFPLDGDLGEAIRENRTAAGMSQPGREEDTVERNLGLGHVLEIYTPLHAADGKVIGAYEIYADPRHTEAFIASRTHVVWVAVAAVFLLLYAALALLVRGASRTLHRQASTLRSRSHDLLESYRRLEESALEAIASLNATVDAKDSYTAGHSARVQAIAVAVAEELGLARDRLDAVRFGGLFHDIGKIAVPDSILSKPGALTDEEYDVIKRHPVDGADIVARFGRLREAVPLIRHHHERWDGRGYPDRLAGDGIPVEACVVGLADAWDAMTTERPYHRALTLDEAAAEVRAGRGTQFAPAVVDAFFAVLKREPVLFELETRPHRAIAAAG